MVDFLQLQEIMKEQLAKDRAVKLVVAKGATLEEAVTQAATLLNVPVRRLEYEITEKGFAGFLGTGKREWTINAYERQKVTAISAEGVEIEADEEAAPVIRDMDGESFVKLYSDGIYIKVVPPVGKGRKVTTGEVIRQIEERNITKIDEALVDTIVKEAKGEYVRFGDYDHRPLNDGMIAVEIIEDEMKALMSVSPPGYLGSDISVETYISILRSNRVVHGINQEFLRNFADKPVYKEKIEIAEASKPINGRDAYIQYNFETDQTKLKLREGINGRIDFKDLNIIQNVVKDQPLAKKNSP